MSQKLREEASNLSGVPADNMPIWADLPVSPPGGGVARDVPTIPHKLQVRQGELVAISGPEGEGKSDLLKLLGGATLPLYCDTVVSVFVPSHLRALHLENEPLFIRDTLYANLVFGLHDPGSQDGSRERVTDICRRLGLRPDVQKLIRSEEVLRWEDILSDAQKQAVSIARALIFNPELLCMETPTEVFDHRQSEKVQALFTESSLALCHTFRFS